jgi:flagellar hook protein FlgE
LFSSIDAAVSGLGAQSAAFGNISENVSNSQTGGYKRIDTNFVDYLSTSTPTENEPGAVVARPAYINDIQGAITQTDNPTAVAVTTGGGFFAVSQATGVVNNVPTFNPQSYYTRSGDFTLNAQGYLVNPAGQYLNAWPVNTTTGAVNQNVLAPVQISQGNYNPVATANLTLSANLPATPASGTAIATNPLSSQITVYDGLGTAHIVNLNWTQQSTNNWTVQINVPDAADSASGSDPAADYSTDAGSANVSFGPNTSNATAPDGTISQIAASTTDPGTVSTAGFTTNGTPASLSFITDFGSGPQTIKLNLGDYGGTTGMTQFAGTTYTLNGITQDGVAPGSYTGVSLQASGNIVLNYSNGQTTTVAQVPLVTFKAPDALQSQNGQSFTATNNSGTPLANAVGTNGAGNLVVQSVEGSNVDIASEFSDLIVAQQAYSSNAKVVTTANTMLQATLQMIT